MNFLSAWVAVIVFVLTFSLILLLRIDIDDKWFILDQVSNSIVLCCLVYIPVLIVYTLMSPIRKNNVNKSYERNGTLEDWYDIRVDQLGTKWCLDVSKSLMKHFTLKDRISFLSPTANKGIYEDAIFEAIARDKTISMTISDFADIKDYVTDKSIYSSELRYHPRKNALDYLQSNEKYDVLFDMKGAAWHFGKNLEQLNNLLVTYHHILEDDGLLIFDDEAKDASSLKLFLHMLKQSLLFQQSEKEPSTIQRIRSNKRCNLLLNQYFQQNDVIYIKTASETLCLRFYQKKI